MPKAQIVLEANVPKPWTDEFTELYPTIKGKSGKKEMGKL